MLPLFLAIVAQHGQPPVRLASTSGILSTTILGNEGPAPSLSGLSFFVNFNSRATICYGVPHKPSDFVSSHPSSRPTVASYNSTFGNTQNCDQRRFLESYGLPMNPMSCHGFPPSHFARFPTLPVLLLFRTCVAERRSQLSNRLSSAMRTLVCVQLQHGVFCIVDSPLEQPCDHSSGRCGTTSTQYKLGSLRP